MNQLQHLYPEELYNIKPKVLVVIARPWSELQEDEIALLTKILNAVKVPLAAVQIVTRNSFLYQDFANQKPSHIISFGSVFQDSPEMYEPVLREIPVVVAHELRDLDDVRKKSLWTALRQIFHG